MSSKTNEGNAVLAGALVVCGVPMLLFVLWLLVSPWRGYALTILWRWFVVPLGMPELPLWDAMGLSMIVAYLTYEQPERPEGKWWGRIGQMVLTPAIMLAFGWLTLAIFK